MLFLYIQTATAQIVPDTVFPCQYGKVFAIRTPLVGAVYKQGTPIRIEWYLFGVQPLADEVYEVHCSLSGLEGNQIVAHKPVFSYSTTAGDGICRVDLTAACNWTGTLVVEVYCYSELLGERELIAADWRSVEIAQETFLPPAVPVAVTCYPGYGQVCLDPAGGDYEHTTAFWYNNLLDAQLDTAHTGLCWNKNWDPEQDQLYYVNFVDACGRFAYPNNLKVPVQVLILPGAPDQTTGIDKVCDNQQLDCSVNHATLDVTGNETMTQYQSDVIKEVNKANTGDVTAIARFEQTWEDADYVTEQVESTTGIKQFWVCEDDLYTSPGGVGSKVSSRDYYGTLIVYIDATYRDSKNPNSQSVSKTFSCTYPNARKVTVFRTPITECGLGMVSTNPGFEKMNKDNGNEVDFAVRTNGDNLYLTVADVYGRVHYREDVSSMGNVHISGLPRGYYIASLTGEGKIYQTERVIVY